jgi:casein kinase I family protein HRR25
MGMHQDCHKVNIIDFGLANKYRNEDTLNHIPYHTYKSLTGTARYASVNSHLGIEQTRRDDLESLAYVLIYFLRGSMPWQHLEGSAKKQKYQRVKQRKLKTSTLELCSGIPNEFHTFLCYARDLRFNAEPNYDYIRKLFKKLFTAKGYRYDHNYDWSQKCVGIPVPNSGFSADLASKLRPRKGSCDSGAGGSAGH